MIEESILEDYFKYHPPTTEERKKLHEQCNKTSYELAKLISDNISDFHMKQEFFKQIQFMRMMLNQHITMNEVMKEKGFIPRYKPAYDYNRHD